MTNDYWKELIPRIIETVVSKGEEQLRGMGTQGEVLSDFARKVIGRESYYEQQAREENERYWADYAKNTGIGLDEIKYPIKAGSNWNHPIQSMPIVSAVTKPMKMLYGGMS